MPERILPLPQDLDGMRADLGLARLLGISRTKMVTLLDNGAVRDLDNMLVGKSQILNYPMTLSIKFSQTINDNKVELTPVDNLEIVYEDSYLIVVNKPAGVAAHPSPGWSGPTVLGALRAAGYSICTSGPLEREGIVHRLDAGTTGLMMVAKTENAYLRLKNMFRNHEVKKIYHALVQGHVEPLRATIDAPIGRKIGKEFRMCIMQDGKESITHYDTIEVLPGATLLKIELETGRTHQIRVHLASLHHPCLGDTMYGADPKLASKLGLERQWLHAKKLEFIHPITATAMVLQCDYAPDLELALKACRF